jgi:hypothetical protein
MWDSPPLENWLKAIAVATPTKLITLIIDTKNKKKKKKTHTHTHTHTHHLNCNILRPQIHVVYYSVVVLPETSENKIFSVP